VQCDAKRQTEKKLPFFRENDHFSCYDTPHKNKQKVLSLCVCHINASSTVIKTPLFYLIPKYFYAERCQTSDTRALIIRSSKFSLKRHPPRWPNPTSGIKENTLWFSNIHRIIIFIKHQAFFSNPFRIFSLEFVIFLQNK
jgi:hypothetical protein